MSEKEKAKKYLQNKQLTIHYFKIDRDNTYITNENLVYDVEENKVYIMVMTEKEYRDIHFKRHI